MVDLEDRRLSMHVSVCVVRAMGSEHRPVRGVFVAVVTLRRDNVVIPGGILCRLSVIAMAVRSRWHTVEGEAEGALCVFFRLKRGS